MLIFWLFSHQSTERIAFRECSPHSLLVVSQAITIMQLGLFKKTKLSAESCKQACLHRTHENRLTDIKIWMNQLCLKCHSPETFPYSATCASGSGKFPRIFYDKIFISYACTVYTHMCSLPLTLIWKDTQCVVSQNEQAKRKMEIARENGEKKFNVFSGTCNWHPRLLIIPVKFKAL